MLVSLHVKNLAIIDEADVTFGSGLNILTGETGAGKSVIIGSINLTLGEKSRKNVIRTGAESALTELVFSVDEELSAKLAAIDVYPEDGLVVIGRKFTKERSMSRINGETVTLAKVRAAASLLLDIHGQQENATLLTPKNHLEILDKYCHDESLPVRKKVAELVKKYHEKQKELEGLTKDEAEIAREVDFLQFEVDEVEDLNLREGEEEELAEKYRKYLQSEKVSSAVSEAIDLVDGFDGASEKIGAAVKALSKLPESEETEDILNQISEVESLISDLSRSLADHAEDYAFDEADFARTEERLDDIRGVMAKHGGTYESVMEFVDEASKKLEKLSNYEAYKEKTAKEADKLKEDAIHECEKLTKLRKKYAKILKDKVTCALEDLNFLDVKFDVEVSRGEMSDRGADEVTFFISTNPGEPERPLNEIASGGELSRIMLAIKSVMADTDDIPTLIFDEIDTGISGRTAQKVAEKMTAIASHRQVIAITHLAQIAAMADDHFLIEKKVVDGHTATGIRSLSQDEMIDELSRILGGVTITDSVRTSAIEMKKLALEAKKTKK